MSLSKAQLSRRGLILSALALSACGFEPVFQSGSNANLNALRGRVELPQSRNPELLAIRSELKTYFGEPINPVYQLKINYRSSTESLQISQGGGISRRRLTASGQYEATDLVTNQQIFSKDFHRVASYSSGSDRIQNDATLENTKISLAQSVADAFAQDFLIALRTYGAL